MFLKSWCPSLGWCPYILSRIRHWEISFRYFSVGMKREVKSPSPTDALPVDGVVNVPVCLSVSKMSQESRKAKNRITMFIDMSI